MALYIDHQGTSGETYYRVMFFRDDFGDRFAYSDTNEDWEDYAAVVSINVDYGNPLTEDADREGFFVDSIDDLPEPSSISGSIGNIQVEIWKQSGGSRSRTADTNSIVATVTYDFDNQEEVSSATSASTTTTTTTTTSTSLTDDDLRLIRAIYQNTLGLRR